MMYGGLTAVAIKIPARLFIGVDKLILKLIRKDGKARTA